MASPAFIQSGGCSPAVEFLKQVQPAFRDKETTSSSKHLGVDVSVVNEIVNLGFSLGTGY